MIGHVPQSLYAPARQDDIIFKLSHGQVPEAFVRRMRMINCLSAVTLRKMDESLLKPFDVLDIHHILDQQISQDAIISGLNNDALATAILYGNTIALRDQWKNYSLLKKGIQTGWIDRFFMQPFDPICIMLAMRCKVLLDLADEFFHSYNLLRALGFGFIDYGEIPGEEPGNPGDYYPPYMDNPIEPVPWLPPPLPGEPGGPSEPGGPTPEAPTPGAPTPGAPAPGEPAPGGPGYCPTLPGPGEVGYVAIVPGPGPGVGAANGGGGMGGMPGPGLGSSGMSESNPPPGDPCADKDDPTKKVHIGYHSLLMGFNEVQSLSVVGYHPRFTPSNYHWEIASGEGELSASTGYGVDYTAPANNPDCDANPTINLVCEGVAVSSITIAISKMTTEDALKIYPAITGNSCGEYFCSWLRDLQWMRCDGTVRTITHRCDGNCSKVGGGASWGWAYVNCIGPDPACWDGGNLEGNDAGDGTCDAGCWDYRTTQMKLDGCCPIP